MAGGTGMCDGVRWTHVSWDTPFVLQLCPDLNQSKSHLQPGLQGWEEHASKALCSVKAEMSQPASGSAGKHAPAGEPRSQLNSELRPAAQSTCGSF